MAARVFLLCLITCVCGVGLSCTSRRRTTHRLLVWCSSRERAALKRFVQWCLTEGQAFNEPLGYLRLPPHVVTRGLAALQGL
jgi:hypothetical protein